MSTTDSSDKDYEDDFEWTSYNEVQLIYSMGTLKPLGINQHFVMSSIIEKFCTAIGRNIPGNIIIDKVESYYNISEVKKDTRPYSGACEFSLPLNDFPACIARSDSSSTSADKDDRKRQSLKKKAPEKKTLAKRPRHTQ